MSNPYSTKSGRVLTDKECDEMYKFVERMWNLGNSIIAFSAAQALVFLYGLFQYHLAQELKSAQIGIHIAIGLCGAFAAALIWGCNYQEKELLKGVDAPQEAQDASKHVYFGRLAVQVLISLGTMLLFYAALRYSHAPSPHTGLPASPSTS